MPPCRGRHRAAPPLWNDLPTLPRQLSPTAPHRPSGLLPRSTAGVAPGECAAPEWSAPKTSGNAWSR